MREIKFRAWDKRKEVMREVAVLHSNKLTKKVSGIEHWTGELSLKSIHANYINVMQYTGLKDKNGVEIYEGDILCGWIGSHWHSGEDKFEEVVKYDEKTASYNFPAIEVRHGDLRVIGNIFESGEILNDSENPE